MENNNTNLDPMTALLLGINSNPEITGTDNMELNFEFPIGKSSIKMNLKFTSFMASSIVAQQALNDMAKENIEFIGTKIGEGINYVLEHLSEWTEKALDASIAQKRHRKWYPEYYQLEEA